MWPQGQSCSHLCAGKHCRGQHSDAVPLTKTDPLSTSMASAILLLDISVGLCWTCDSVSCSFSYHIALHFYLDFCKLQDFTLFLNRSCPTVRMLLLFFLHSPADRHFSCLLSFTNVTFAPVIMEGKHLNRRCKCPEVELLGHKVVRYSYQTWSLHLM